VTRSLAIPIGEGDWSLKVGFVGAGTVTGTFGRHWIPSHTVASNSRGPETLAYFVADHSYGAILGTKEQADEYGAVILATRPIRVADALQGIDWRGRILVDVTNRRVDPVPHTNLAGVTRSGAVSNGCTFRELVAEMTVAASLAKPISDMLVAPERGTIS
jgi:8-hydroxy-5-deazaflavin:NADPH oxidoreductase